MESSTIAYASGVDESMPDIHTPLSDCGRLVALFDSLFAEAENTRLVPGGREPLYLPADADCRCHRIVFREDFVASALHEVAHWCIAGAQRRLLVDFGYWYCPDGRDEKQQRAFEQSEARPQALEWIFSTSARLGFRPSLDNLSQGASDGSVFAVAIAREARRYCERGLPSRAERFRRALAHEFGGALELNPADYRVDRLPGSGA